jgi:hypothetical protein
MGETSVGFPPPPNRSLTPLEIAERRRSDCIKNIEGERQTIDACTVRIEEMYRSKAALEDVIDSLMKAERSGARKEEL